MGDIDVAAPDPDLAQLLLPRDQRDGLRIMNEHDITGKIKFADVSLADIHKQRIVFGTYVLGPAVKGIMELFGDLEERLIALDNTPPGIDAELIEQGDHAGQYLRHAATGERRVDILYDFARQFAAQEPEVLNKALPNDGLVVGDIYLILFSISRISVDLIASSVLV